jgi:NADH-quinone oxidoreductase subunit L
LSTAAWLVLGLPLLGCLVLAFTYRIVPARASGVIGTVAIGAAFVCAVITFFDLQARDEHSRQVAISLYDYASSVGVDAQMSILVDPLSVLMMLIVTGVSLLIHLYSTAYMASDQGYRRFFAYLNYFVFSMLLLVMAGNFILLIAGWAAVATARYLLISLWYRRTTATNAGLKSFIIQVIGDAALVLGTFLLFRHTGTVDFLRTFEGATTYFHKGDGDVTAACLLLLVGAIAKSAQIPLHTWLPDAMEGPTPVSALIHAATMVTAGVYLIARMHPLFELAPAAATAGAIIGAVTLLVAGTIGLVVTDLKRVIAYSTMSQIGYMVMAVSSAAYAAGMFHMMTHAFFKALLFMAAGSVIAAMAGNQDLNRMSGFRRSMRFTYGCMVVGGLALSGIPPFSGFFSKDEILSLLLARDDWHVVLAILGYIGALMTAIYTFRMIFRAFWGEPCEEALELERGHLYHAPEHTNPATGEVEDTDVGFPGPDHHIAEREASMRTAMGALAVLATIGGAVQIPHVNESLHKFLEPTFHDSRFYESLEASGTLTIVGMLVGAAVGVLGIFIAYTLWVTSPERPAAIQARFRALHSFFVHKWYYDELYDGLIVRPVAMIGRFARNTIERGLVQGALVGGTSSLVRAASSAVRGVQSGYLRYYAALLLVGLTGLSAYFLISA